MSGHICECCGARAGTHLIGAKFEKTANHKTQDEWADDKKVTVRLIRNEDEPTSGTFAILKGVRNLPKIVKQTYYLNESDLNMLKDAYTGKDESVNIMLLYQSSNERKECQAAFQLVELSLDDGKYTTTRYTGTSKSKVKGTCEGPDGVDKNTPQEARNYLEPTDKVKLEGKLMLKSWRKKENFGKEVDGTRDAIKKAMGW